MKNEHTRQWNNKQNLSRFKPYGTTRTTNISLKKINWNWAIFVWWNWSLWTDCQKNVTIQDNHRDHRHRPNYINSDHWRNFHCSKRQCVGLLVGIALSRTSLLLSLATVVTQKFSKTFTLKQEKHNSIKLLAQSKLDSIANIISQAMQDEVISFTEFHKVLQEVEKYCKL